MKPGDLVRVSLETTSGIFLKDSGGNQYNIASNEILLFLSHTVNTLMNKEYVFLYKGFTYTRTSSLTFLEIEQYFEVIS